MASLTSASDEGSKPATFKWAPRPAPDYGFDAASRNYNLVLFRGIPQNPNFRPDALEDLVSNFETRFHDVFICTYPKCGTTWMQQICHLLVNGGHQGDTTMYSTSPWLECLCANQLLHEREANSYTLEDIAGMPVTRPRFFKSHANYKDMPRGQAPVKTIIVSRNPKDTCVSLWHHSREKKEFNLARWKAGIDSEGEFPEVCPSFSDFVKLFLSGQCECGSWFDHTLEWYAASLSDPDILFIKYEDLVADSRDGITAVANHIGMGRSEEVIELVVENSSMGKMRKNSGVYAGNIRKGGVGNWRNRFSDEDSKLFDDVYKQQMEGSGLVFDFGDGVIM